MAVTYYVALPFIRTEDGSSVQAILTLASFRTRSY
jgi:hypothetical protein